MLRKKMIRDLWNHKGTYLATMILIMMGILVYTSFSMLHDSFEHSVDVYYNDMNFADGTIKVVGMPKDVETEISRLSGVYKAEGRYEKRVRMLNYEDEITFHFISYNASDENRLNNIQLLDGRMPDPKAKEIIIGNNYFMANELKLGDKISVVINGKKSDLEIVGYGRSAEFIYAKKNDTELVSNPKTFDIVFMPYESMSDIFGLGKQINNIAFKLYEGVELDDIKSDIKEIVHKYGLLKLTDREDQMSHITTKQKLEGIGSMTATIPIMFLFISGFIINIVLKRIIEHERTQIGVLKAFGIPDYKILFHYISYAVLISLVGGVIGMYFGLQSLGPFIDQMGVGFNMPFVTSGLYQKYFAYSLLLCLGFGLFSGYLGAKGCLKLEAAEAMRPPVSKESKAGLMDKFYFLFENMDIKVKLALRNIFRNKARSIFVLFGISVTAALLTFPLSMKDIYDAMLLDQFSKVEIYDTKITLTNYMDRETVVNEVLNRDGVTDVEPQTQIPITIYNKWRNKDTVIIALPTDADLYRIYDDNDNRIKLSANGIVLCQWLAKSIGVEVGDTVYIKSPLFRKDEYKGIKVTQIIPQYIGSNAYMNIDSVRDLLDGEDIVNALMIKGSRVGLANISEMYNDASRVSSFDYRETMAKELEEFMQQTTSVIGILAVVGMIVGFSVIYVSMTISLSERYRELATLLVVGLMEKEVHQVLILEQCIISVFGIILGLPLGKMMLLAMSEASSSDYFVMPTIVPLRAFIFSILLTIVSIIIPQIAARRKIGKIVVTEALNARE